MSRKPLAPRSPGTVILGWYAVVALPAATFGGSVPGLVTAGLTSRAFWAVWWTDDPRRTPNANPDDFGFVLGARGIDEAIGAAYDALRQGRGPRVNDMSLGATFALAAYREGAPQRRSAVTDYDAQAAEGLGALGLPPDATAAEIRKAFKAKHPDNGGDPKVDMDRLTKLFTAAHVAAKRREQEAARASIAAGVEPKRRKPRKSKVAPGPIA